MKPRVRRPSPTGGAAHLTEAERNVLLALWRAHPAATPGQVRMMFRARTGRTIRAEAARLARLKGYEPTGLHAQNERLTEAQSELLRQLLEAAEPHYCRSEVAREFEALTGRPLSKVAVSRFARRTMGLPGLPRGSNSPSARLDGADARIAEARHAKRGAIS